MRVVSWKEGAQSRGRLSSLRGNGRKKIDGTDYAHKETLLAHGVRSNWWRRKYSVLILLQLKLKKRLQMKWQQKQVFLPYRLSQLSKRGGGGVRARLIREGNLFDILAQGQVLIRERTLIRARALIRGNTVINISISYEINSC